MGAKPIVRIEEHSLGRVVSFAANCRAPEAVAWGLLRDWATANIRDHKARRYVGSAPKGHHPDGEEHHPNEEAVVHEYVAQMFLLEDEGQGDTFLGAEVHDAPEGLFLVGDVAMNELNDDGTIDVGSSMMRAYGVMSECLREMGGWEFALDERPFFEEHIFSDDWFAGDGELAGFKLWLPIRRAA